MACRLKNSSSEASSRSIPIRAICSSPSECAYAPVGKSASVVCKRNGSHSVSMRRCGKRVEDLAHACKGNRLALEQLARRRVSQGKRRALSRLDGEMEVSNHPSQPRALPSIADGNLKKRLGSLCNGIEAIPVAKENRAVRQRFLKVKPEVAPILRHAAPAPPGKSEAIRHEDNAPRPIFSNDLVSDDFHDGCGLVLIRRAGAVA